LGRAPESSKSPSSWRSSDDCNLQLIDGSHVGNLHRGLYRNHLHNLTRTMAKLLQITSVFHPLNGVIYHNHQPLRDRSLHHTFAINPTAYFILDMGFTYHFIIQKRTLGPKLIPSPEASTFLFHEGHRGLPKKNQGDLNHAFPKTKSEDMTNGRFFTLFMRVGCNFCYPRQDPCMVIIYLP